MAIHPNQLRSEPTKPTLDGIARWIRQVFNNTTSVIGRAYVDGFTSSDGGTVLQCKVVDIGDWDMDATSGVAVAHGLTVTKIRAASAIIRNDANTEYRMVAESTSSFAGFRAGLQTFDATTITIVREAAGLYDGTDFNATSYNRGFLLIWHTP